MKTRLPGDRSRRQESFELQATLYSSRNPTRRWLHQSRREWISEAVQRYFPVSGDTAMDAGTGCGSLLTRLSKTFHTVIGLDREPAMLRQVGEPAPEGRDLFFIAGDIGLSPLKNNCADLVVFSEVIEHVSDESACLEEIYRVLKPGGLLILTTPQPFSTLELTARIAFLKPLIRLARAIYREPVLAPGHINLMRPGKLEKCLSANGFKIMERHKSGLYIPGLAEIPTPATQKIAARLNDRLSGTKLDFLLWTQFYVAEKPSPPRPRTRPEKEPT